MKHEYLLVTGAAGFIGSAVAIHFLKLGYSVITIDNLSTGKKEVIPNLDEPEPNRKFVIWHDGTTNICT